MKILDRYLAFGFLRSFLLTGSAVALLVALVTTLNDYGLVVRAGEGIGAAFSLAVLAVPREMLQILPMVVDLAAIALFLMLSRHGETIAAEAGGLSPLRGLAGPAAAMLAAGFAVLLLLDPIAAASSRARESLIARYSGAGASVFQVGPGGIWLREGSTIGPRVIHARAASADGRTLRAVSIFVFDRQGRPIRRIEARRARLQPGRWVVEQGTSWLVSARDAAATAVAFDRVDLPSDLAPETVTRGLDDPATVSLWRMPETLARLEAAGLSTTRLELQLHKRLALPLLAVAVLLAAAAFTMQPTRFGHAGLRILMALISGFFLFFLDVFARILGENGQIPPPLAAWAPALGGLLLTSGLILWLEDRR